MERLVALRPEVYADLTRDQLGAALKPYGITTTQVWGTDAGPARAPTGAASSSDHIDRGGRRNVTGAEGIKPPDPSACR